MTDEEHAATLDRILTALREASQDRMLAHTVPIYRAFEGGNPRSWGSGVLLRIADASFLLSCAHVLKEAANDAALLTCGADNELLVNLSGSKYGWTEDEQNEDLGFARLPQEAVELISPRKSFLRLSDVEFDRTERTGIYSVLGYPIEKAEYNAEAHHVNSTPFAFTGYPYAGHLNNHVAGLSIALELNRNVIGDRDGNPARLPGLHGISGCGIWRLAALDGSAKPDVSGAATRLIGIEHSISDRAILGSHIAALIDIIHDEFPDLRASIDLHR